ISQEGCEEGCEKGNQENPEESCQETVENRDEGESAQSEAGGRACDRGHTTRTKCGRGACAGGKANSCTDKPGGPARKYLHNHNRDRLSERPAAYRPRL